MWSLIKLWSFYIAISADIIAILVAFYFIITDAMRGLAYKNDQLLLITVGMCIWTLICIYLKWIGSTGIASTMAWLPAFPILGYALMILMFIILKPDMK